MNLRAMAAIVVLAAVPAWAEPAERGPLQRVPACVAMAGNTILGNQAQGIAQKMFARAGVAIEWNPGWRPCPTDAIRIDFTSYTPADYMPGALGFAQPFEGVHIRIFLDRVQQAVTPGRVPCLLAHVLVHEITHILQGVNTHAAGGIMKPSWDQHDYAQMAWRPLPFTAGDIRLIQQGMKERASHRNSLAAVIPAAKEEH